MSQQFHIGDILGIATGVCLGRGSNDKTTTYPFEGIRILADYLAGESLFELQICDMKDQMKAHLIRQFPWLETVKVPDFRKGKNGQAAISAHIDMWLSGMAAQYGEWLIVRPMFEGDVSLRSPIDIATEINPNIKAITLDATAEEPPSPTGDINWKVE
jgi:hypothetical protein